MFSTNVKQENLSIILDSLIEPIQDSNNQSHHVTSKIVVSESESSSVYRDPLEFQKYLEGITVNRTEIKAGPIFPLFTHRHPIGIPIAPRSQCCRDNTPRSGEFWSQALLIP